MKKYMLSLMLIAASCALPIMAMESDNQQIELAVNRFKVAYPELQEFYTLIKTRKTAVRGKKIAAYKKYFDKLITVAIKDRNYFTNTAKDNKNIPCAYLEEVITQGLLQKMITAIEREKEWNESILATTINSPLFKSDFESTIHEQEVHIKTLKELHQKGLAAIETIKDMQKKGEYNANPEYHALKLTKYAYIAGGIALAAAAIVGIGYWIKKLFVDKNKQTTQPTNKPHITS